MEIHLEFGSTEPPVGRASLMGDAISFPFAGWLELMSVIERHLLGGRAASGQDPVVHEPGPALDPPALS